MTALAWRHGPILAVFLLYTIVVVRTAFLNDDATITLRTVYHFLHGEGMRYNISERVQAFTHPLWFFALTGACLVSNSYFIAPIVLAIAVALAAVALLLFGIARNTGLAVLAGAAFVASRGFVDYSTSGLENPMTNLLLAVFAIFYFRESWTPRVVYGMSFIAGLLVLNRMDCLLFVAPPLAYVWLSDRSLRHTLRMASGFVPFLLWEIFSIVYYGFPFPNTAYAKLGTLIPASEMAVHGLYYYYYSLTRDPTLLPAIVGGLAAPFLFRRSRECALAAGALLYLLYIVKIGGDFMGGRFFTAPLFVAMILLARIPWRPWTIFAVAAAGLVIYLSALAPRPPISSGRDYGATRDGFMGPYGIADERMFYYPGCGLLRWDGKTEMPSNHFAQMGRDQAKAHVGKDRWTWVYGAAGMPGLYAGPGLHLIDLFALTDPLLARLPMLYKHWRIGHFPRALPLGYQESLEDPAKPNKIKDADLGKYYEKLALIVSGPLWTWERWKTIVNMNLGLYDHLVHRNEYRFFGMRMLDLAAVSKPRPSTEIWNARGTFTFGKGGLGIRLGGLQHARGIEMSLNDAQAYRVLFLRGDDVLGNFTAGPAPQRTRRLAVYELAVPAGIAKGGYDTVRLVPLDGKAKDHALGHLRLLP